MLNRIKIVAALVLTIGTSVAAAIAHPPSIAVLDAAARAVGNRRDIAQHIGEALFATPWAAEVNQISANELDDHLIVGIRMWGVKFHEPLTRQGFVDEVVALTQRVFSAQPNTEEIDVWASIPLDVTRGEIVSGDLAKPTSQTVFSLNVLRGERPDSLRDRVMRGAGSVYWDQQWAREAFRPQS